MDNSGRPLADEILAYLVQHPQAQDTMEGTVEWWLLERSIRYAIADVEAALRELVGNDFLVARRSSEGRTYCRLIREKEREIRQHLRSTEPPHGTKPEPTERDS